MNIRLEPAPHNKQIEVINSCSFNSPNLYTTVVAGRQAGKSTTAKHQAIYWALTYPNSKIWFVMPSEGQGRSQHRDIVQALQGTNLIKSKKASSGSIEIIFTNGTVLEFKSASSNSLRGTPINFLIIDEAAFIRRSVIEEDLLPALTVAGRKVLICSTPKGKNWFYGFYLRGLQEGQNSYKSFKFLSSDNPSAKLDTIMLAKQSIPEAVFNQEYMAEFVEGAEVFNNIYDVCCLKMPSVIEMSRILPVRGKSYYCGIDIGLINDDTVVTIFDGDGNMIMIDRFTNIETGDCVERILRHLELFKPLKATIETNGQGLTVYDYIRKEYKNIESFTTTNQSKEEIINRLISGFSGKILKCFNDEEIILQLQSFVFEMTQTGKIRYKAADGFHDDIVMSMALAYSNVFDRKIQGGYSIVTSDNFIENENSRFSEGKKSSKIGDLGFYNGQHGLSNGPEGEEFLFFT